MFKRLFKFFVAKCDTIPEEDPTKVQCDGEFPDEGEGYFALDLYPERRGDQYTPSMTRRLLVGARREITLKNQCQAYVFAAAMERMSRIAPAILLGCCHLLHTLDKYSCVIFFSRSIG